MERIKVLKTRDLANRSTWNVRSKRTWSLPAPVEPWATQSAPTDLAYSMMAMAWKIRSELTEMG